MTSRSSKKQGNVVCNSAICTSCPTVQKGGPGWLCLPLICLTQPPTPTVTQTGKCCNIYRKQLAICKDAFYPTVQKGGPGWLCLPLICLRQALLLPPLRSESLHHRSIFLFPSLQPECVAAHVHLWLVHSMLGQKVNMKLDVHTKFCFKYVLPGFILNAILLQKWQNINSCPVRKILSVIWSFICIHSISMGSPRRSSRMISTLIWQILRNS